MSVLDSTLWIRFPVEVQRLKRWEVPQPVRPVSAPASNPMLMADTTEELRKRPEIRKELERARGEKRSEKVETEGGDKFWFVVYAVVLAICAAIFFALGAKLTSLSFDQCVEILFGYRCDVVVFGHAHSVSPSLRCIVCSALCMRCAEAFAVLNSFRG